MHLIYGWEECRYADDGLIHCKTEEQAKKMLEALRRRFTECGIELQEEKTKIIYCKDSNRKEKYPNKSFDFLGYRFRCREARNTNSNTLFGSFSPAVSKLALKSMRNKTRKLNWRKRTDLSLEDISKLYPILLGWKNYYGKYYKSAMRPVWAHFNKTLIFWAMHKYKCFRKKKTKAAIFIENIAVKHTKLFVHWEEGIMDVFA